MHCYGLSFRIVLGLVPITLGFLIFARRRSEPIALSVSFFLITWTTSGGAIGVLTATYPTFHIPAEIIDLLSTVSLPLFFGLFPNGRMVPRLYWFVVAYFGAWLLCTDYARFGQQQQPSGIFLDMDGVAERDVWRCTSADLSLSACIKLGGATADAAWCCLAWV